MCIYSGSIECVAHVERSIVDRPLTEPVNIVTRRIVIVTLYSPCLVSMSGRPIYPTNNIIAAHLLPPPIRDSLSLTAALPSPPSA